VNGAKIEGRIELRAGDKILIGGQELTLLNERDEARGTGMAGGVLHAAKLTLPKMAPAVRDEPSYRLPDSEPEPSMVRRADAFKLLGGVAEKALAMGRAAEAERLLASALADIIETTRAGRSIPPSLMDQAAKFSAK